MLLAESFGLDLLKLYIMYSDDHFFAFLKKCNVSFLWMERVF